MGDFVLGFRSDYLRSESMSLGEFLNFSYFIYCLRILVLWLVIMSQIDLYGLDFVFNFFRQWILVFFQSLG